MDKYQQHPYVLMGTCGWTDDTLARCGRFYPSSVKTATDRLRHYSRHYPCVEVDTSTYAIPRQQQIREWMSVVPAGFLFHIKVFGLIPARSIAPGALPRDLRAAHLTPAQESVPRLALSAMPGALVDAIWERMNSAVDVLFQGGKLGVVVFQFHPSFEPSSDTFAYLAECRRRLYPVFPMAVELRSRVWFSMSPPSAVFPEADYPTPAPADAPAPTAFATQRDATLYFFRRLGLSVPGGVINIPSDDLVEEWPAHDVKPPAEPDGTGRALIVDDVTDARCAYVRLHRRVGSDRLLTPEEHADWARRLGKMAATADLPREAVRAWRGTALRGPVFFMFGTDWEDQPMLNMKRLAEAVSAAHTAEIAASATASSSAAQVTRPRVYDWRADARAADSKTGLLSYFGAPKPAAASASTSASSAVSSNPPALAGISGAPAGPALPAAAPPPSVASAAAAVEVSDSDSNHSSERPTSGAAEKRSFTSAFDRDQQSPAASKRTMTVAGATPSPTTGTGSGGRKPRARGPSRVKITNLSVTSAGAPSTTLHSFFNKK